MRKYFYVLSTLVLLFVFSSAEGQKYTFTPSDSLFQTDTTNSPYDIEIMTIYLYDISSDSITVVWNTLSDTAAIGWTTGLCDNNNCYYGTGLNNHPPASPIGPGDSLFLRAEFTPSCISGSGAIAISVHVIGDTSTPTQLNYKSVVVSTCAAAAGIAALSGANAIRIYPTPSSDIVNLSGLPISAPLSISLTDLEGRVVKTYTGIGTELMQLDISQLNTGLFLLKVVNLDNKQVFTGKISKI